MWCIFLKSKLNDNSKKYFSKIFGLGPSPLDHHIFWKKHPREKCQKVNPHYFSILFSTFFTFFSKNPSKCLKTAIFPLKLSRNCSFETLRVILERHLSLGCFFQKIWWSRGLGSNPKIFEKYFLELSYNLLFKNM